MPMREEAHREWMRRPVADPRCLRNAIGIGAVHSYSRSSLSLCAAPLLHRQAMSLGVMMSWMSIVGLAVNGRGAGRGPRIGRMR